MADIDLSQYMDAVAEATALGCTITREQDQRPTHYRPARYHWSYGTHARSSNDHYGVSFGSAEEAAKHFLGSREGQQAIARKLRRLRLPPLRLVK